MTRTQGLCTESIAGETWNRQRGYSLVEALIVVFIGLILTGLAVPMVQSALRSYTVNSAANNVSRLIGVSRYAGITQGRNSCTLFAGNQFGLDPDCDGAFGTNDSRVQIPNGVTVSSSTTLSLTSLPFSPAPDEFLSSCTTYAITFNTRGSKTRVCTTDTGGAITNIFYLTGWGNTTAVTITGTGRARSWQFISGTWQ